MSLDQTLIALLEKHDLTSVSLHASRGTSGNTFYCFAHWAGDGCAHKYGGTITEALANTIAAANEERIQFVAVPALELGEAA